MTMKMPCSHKIFKVFPQRVQAVSIFRQFFSYFFHCSFLVLRPLSLGFVLFSKFILLMRSGGRVTLSGEAS